MLFVALTEALVQFFSVAYSPTGIKVTKTTLAHAICNTLHGVIKASCMYITRAPIGREPHVFN